MQSVNKEYLSIRNRSLIGLCLSALLLLFFYINQQPFASKLIDEPYDKIVHAVIFCCFAIFSCIVIHPDHGLFSAAFCHLLAFTDELLQQTLPGRNASIYDLVADSAGIFLGCFIAMIGYRIWLENRPLKHPTVDFHMNNSRHRYHD